MGTLDVDAGDKIRRLTQELERPDSILRGIGAMMVAASQRAFREQKFGDVAWEPRGPINVMGIIADFAAGKSEPPKRRFEDRPALRDTGRLAQSITFRVVGATELEVGSNLPYAKVHQDGGETQSAPLTDTIRERIAAWLDGRGSKYRKALGWLLANKFRNQPIKSRVHARPFVGITKEIREDAEALILASIVK